MDLMSLQAGFTRLSGDVRRSGTSVGSSVAKLSSGERISSASEDVAGLSVATKMQARIQSLRSSLINLSQASSLLQVAEGGLREIDGLLQRMNQLTTISQSGILTTADRIFLDIEFQTLQQEIDRIAESTSFNGVNLLANPDAQPPEIDALPGVQGIQVNGTDLLDVLDGSEGDDTITAGDGNDRITAGDGDDTIDIGRGMDSVDGGTGDDVIIKDISEVNPTLVDSTVPITDNLVLHVDADAVADITGHPGTVTGIVDQSAFGNNVTPDTGAVLSGTDEITGRNSLTFDGSSILQVADTPDINVGAQSQRSIMLVFETSADITSRQVLYEQGGTVNGYNIYIDGGQLYFGTWKNSGATFNHHIAIDIDTNTSYAAGLVFDFSGAGTFRAYVNGSQVGELALPQSQNSHVGDIGIGGMNNDTRFFNASGSGSGFGFTGEIGELVNYRDALDATEAVTVQNYLQQRWGIGTSSLPGTVEGGEGQDTLKLDGDALVTTLNGTGLQGVETLDLIGNDEEHVANVRDGHFTTGTGVEGDIFTIKATGNTNAIRVDGSELTGNNIIRVLGGDGRDTIEGDNNGNVQVSYENATKGVDVNLRLGTAEGQGSDTLQNLNYVAGSNFEDNLSGSQFNDTMIGGDGDDVITDITLPEDGGRIPLGGLVSFLDASNTTAITTHPGTVTSITDPSGAGNNILSDTGVVTSGSSSIKGVNSLAFDGSSFLRINNTADINLQNVTQRSIFVSFETSTDVETRQVLYEEGGGTHGMNIYIENGQVHFTAWRSGGAVNLRLSANISEQTAYVGGFVFDSTGAMNFTGYLNGEQIGQVANNQAILSHSGQIGVGGMNNASFFNGAVGGDGLEFTGEIGELLIYNNPLTGEQLTDLNNFLIERRVNNGGNDSLLGGGGDDLITGGIGNDTIDGGTGEDTAVYSGDLRHYTLYHIGDGEVRIVDNRRRDEDGSDLLRDVEVLRFADGDVRLADLGIASTADGNLTFQVSEEFDEVLEVALMDVTTNRLFDGETPDIRSIDNAAIAADVIKRAISIVTFERARVGATQASTNILQSQVDVRLHNQRFAHGAIADTNIAQQSTQYSLDLLRNQMSIATMVQANGLRANLVNDILSTGIAVPELAESETDASV